MAEVSNIETTDTAVGKNQILKLLDLLPRGKSMAIEIQLREKFRGKWFQTWRNPAYNPARIRAVDMIELKKILGVTDEFFLGTPEQIDAQLKKVLKENSVN